MHILALAWLACSGTETPATDSGTPPPPSDTATDQTDTATAETDTGGPGHTQDSGTPATTPRDPAGWNVLTNPGFETGDATGWRTDGAVTTEDPHSGAHALGVPARAQDGVILTQDVRPWVEPDRPYGAAAWVRVVGPDAAQVALTLTEAGQPSVTVATATVGADWTELAGDFSPPSGDARLILGLEADPLIELVVDDLAFVDPTATLVPADDPAMQRVGRWDLTDPAAPRCGWQGSALQVGFRGTGVGVLFDTGSRSESLRAVVDDDHLGSVKQELEPGLALHVLARDLDDGEHTLEWVKETNYGSAGTLTGVVVFGSGLTEPPSRPARRIEFYGDSNLAGYSLESEQNRGGVDRDGHHFGYAGIIGRLFDAEVQNISWSGSRIAQVHDRFTRVDYDAADDTWDFASNPADLVVVNLGANDVGRAEATIRADYHALLDDLRAVHPDAHIVLYNAWGWDYDETANYTDEVAAERGDANLSVATFPWVFEQWHGCESDHGGMAATLARHLEETLGWTPGIQDVMSGFGADGDVANGSFELSAPFGGYGWRYYTDDGVARIQDAGRAHDGGFFLQLTQDAEVHQPNPAVDGQQVTVTLWLRGGSEADQARLTLDFRDQQMWTKPLQSDTSTVPLTTSWQQTTVSATAPSGGARPVFHTRLTVQAGSESTVDVDHISMTIE